MTRREKALYWTAAFAVFILFLWGFGDILTPFLFGAAIAYFCDPLADRLEAAGLSRTMATLVITACAFLLFVLILFVLIPPLFDQAQRLIARAPDYLERLRALLPAAIVDGQFGGEGENGLADAARDWGIGALKSVLSGGVALIDFISVLVITPVVAFYLLLDWDRLVGAVDDLLPRNHAETIRSLARDIDGVLSAFVRGQGTVCVLLGTYYALALTLVGLDFGLLVGIFAGIISFIPFVGSITGLVLSVGIAIVQFWGEWWWIAVVAAIFLTGQLIEGNVLTPLLVGGSVGLHPVSLLFALSAFGYAFGFAGLLVAVPVAAAVGVLLRWGLKLYSGSDLYQGARD